MALPNFLRRHRYLNQIAAVVIATSTCVLVTDAFSFRSPENLVWMIGVPASVALVGNVGWDRRCFMFMALMILSTATNIFVGVNFTSYR